jgi:hypothetical protein
MENNDLPDCMILAKGYPQIAQIPQIICSLIRVEIGEVLSC